MRSSIERSKGLLRIALTLGLLGLPAASGATEYEIDTAHSAFMFRAKRMGVVYVYGRFNEFSGSISVPGDDAGRASVKIEVRTDSIDTGDDRRDAHLRSPDFFNSKQLPVMEFESSSVAKTGESTYEVTGRLSLHGVTKDVTAVVEHVGSGKDQRGSSLIGFDAVLKLKRTDFDMSFMVGPIGDEIDVHVAIQGVAK